MKAQVIDGTDQVTIRTTDKETSPTFVDITLEVKDKQIVKMFGVDEKGKNWDVKNIKFTVRDREESNDNDECKCCSVDSSGRIVCVTCNCGF